MHAGAGLALGATALAAALAARRRPRLRTALAAAAALCAGALALGARLEVAARGRPDRPLERTLEATVADVRVGPTSVRVDLARVVASDPPGAPSPVNVRIVGRRAPGATPGLEGALPGERLRVRAVLRAPRGRRNPGGPDARRALSRAGIGAFGRLVHPALHVRLPAREGLRPLAPVHAARRALGERLAAVGPGGALLRSLALGDRRGLDERSRDVFARLGLAHLLAVSGLHLSLVASLAYGAARATLGRSAALAARRDAREVALAAALAVATLYALLAGWGVPVRRALVLLLALGLCVARGRRGTRAEPLALAALLVLAAEPQALFSAGAQLSFAASAALAAALPEPAPQAAREVAAPRLRRALAQALRSSATAVAATAPLAAHHLGAVAPLALVANLLAIPATAGAVLPAALLSTLAAAVPSAPGSAALLSLCEAVARIALEGVAAAAAALPPPGAPRAPGVAGLVAAGALALGALRARRTAARVALALLQGAVLAQAPPDPVAPAPPRLVALDVGQGDAVLVQGRRGALLMDAGTAIPGGGDLGARTVLPALAALGVRSIDLLVASHADLDHRGGLPAVLAAIPVGELWLPWGRSPDASFEGLRAAARARGVRVRERGVGAPPADFGDLRVTPLWPPGETAALARNDRSLVLRVEVAGRRVLLPGDVEATAEAALLARGADLRADALVLPHHGSRTSSTRRFLAAVGAGVAVASAPCDGRFGMPHARVMRRARSLGTSVWWTGRDGAVLVGLARPLTAWGFGGPGPGKRGPAGSHCAR